MALGKADGLITPKYNVSILMDRRVLYTHFYYKPGEYRVSVTAPNGVGVGMLIVRLVNEHRQMHEDRVRVVMNAQWYRVIKYMLFAPLVLMAVLFTFIQQQSKHPTSSLTALPQ